MLFPVDHRPQLPGSVPMFILPSYPCQHLSWSAGHDLDAGCAPGVSQQSLENALQVTALVPTLSNISEGKL